MAIDFTKLFKDTSAYPDTLTFKVGDADVSLGDLRQYNTSTGGELAKQLDTQRKQLEADQNKLQTASERVAQMYIDVEAQKKALATTTPANRSNEDPLAKYEKDEVFGPVVAYARSLESKLDKVTNETAANVDKLVKAVAQMGTTYMGDKASMDFSALPADDPVRPKDLTLDAMYKYAVENRVYDRNNLPDIKTAYDKLTGPARQAHEIKEAEKRGAAKRDTELAEAAMLPRPVSGLPALPDGMKPPININDAFNKAGTDRDLWKTINAASVQ